MTKPANIPMSVIFFTFGEEGALGTLALPIDSTEPAWVVRVSRSGAMLAMYVHISAESWGFCVVAEMDITSVSFTEAIVTSDFIWLAEM
ncbi:unknown [Ruminococcus sp. CAG:579]|nr:unknown [Ruminococcus sp. CAG:579]